MKTRVEAASARASRRSFRKKPSNRSTRPFASSARSIRQCLIRRRSKSTFWLASRSWKEQRVYSPRTDADGRNRLGISDGHARAFVRYLPASAASIARCGVDAATDRRRPRYGALRLAPTNWLPQADKPHLQTVVLLPVAAGGNHT